MLSTHAQLGSTEEGHRQTASPEAHPATRWEGVTPQEHAHISRPAWNASGVTSSTAQRRHSAPWAPPRSGKDWGARIE
eukprot:8998936-Pyramimonas_sp.AAC.1